MLVAGAVILQIAVTGPRLHDLYHLLVKALQPASAPRLAAEAGQPKFVGLPIRQLDAVGGSDHPDEARGRLGVLYSFKQLLKVIVQCRVVVTVHRREERIDADGLAKEAEALRSGGVLSHHPPPPEPLPWPLLGSRQ